MLLVHSVILYIVRSAETVTTVVGVDRTILTFEFERLLLVVFFDILPNTL